MIVVDTSVLSLIFRRRMQTTASPVAELFRSLVDTDVPVALPGVVLQELLSGVRSSQQEQLLLDSLSGFDLLLATRDDHLMAARLFNECQSNGVSIAAVDALIAAQTIVRRAVLFTTDTDFARIANLVGLELLDIPGAG